MLSGEEHVELTPGNIMRNRAKTHCINGHEFDEANTRIDSRGYRHCRACGRAQYSKARYRHLRANTGPGEIAAFNLHANALARMRRKADPGKVRALERAKYARRIARDPAGFRARRRAIDARYRQNKKLRSAPGVHVELHFPEEIV